MGAGHHAQRHAERKRGNSKLCHFPSPWVPGVSRWIGVRFLRFLSGPPGCIGQSGGVVVPLQLIANDRKLAISPLPYHLSCPPCSPANSPSNASTLPAS